MSTKVVPIVIVNYNTLWYIRRLLESIVAFTNLPHDVIVVDNGSTDGAKEYLKGLGDKIHLISLEENAGWVGGINIGMKAALAYYPDYIVFGNSDIVMGDPLWLERLLGPLRLEDVGAVGPVSNYVMGIQSMEHNLAPLHEAKFLIGLCVAVRADVAEKVCDLNFGKFMDDRFGLGGNDDLDLSIRIRRLGYRLMVNRLAFIYHYGSKTLLDVFGGWKGIKREDERTRALLVEKWGQEAVDDLFVTPRGLMPTPYREWRNPHDYKEKADKVLEDFDEICREVGIEYRLVSGTCLGFYRDGAYIPTDDDIDIRLVGTNGKFKLLCNALRDYGFETEESEYKFQHFWRDHILLDVLRGGFAWGERFDTLTYNGREYKVPFPVEGYLEDCYGTDWRVPK